MYWKTTITHATFFAQYLVPTSVQWRNSGTFREWLKTDLKCPDKKIKKKTKTTRKAYINIIWIFDVDEDVIEKYLYLSWCHVAGGYNVDFDVQLDVSVRVSVGVMR